jgi:hypothetical protein
MSDGNYIANAKLAASAGMVKVNEPFTLDLRFKVAGRVRDVFNQQTWTDAYNKHDTVFRIKYVVKVQSGSVRKKNLVEPVTFVRKASFYWSRNPKLPPPPPEKKIWAMVVTDDKPNLPDSVEEAKSLVFDVRREIQLIGSHLGKGRHRLTAHVTASWGRHRFIEKMEISGKTNEITVECV